MDTIRLTEENGIKNMVQEQNAEIGMVRKRKEDFGKFVANTLQNSMLTGIPQIAKAGNWPKKLTRTLVFIFCMTGFIYQSYSFMKVYWEYDVVMNVEVSNPFFVKQPAVTICYDSGYKSEEACEDPEMEAIMKQYKLSCYEANAYDEDICRCNPRMCDSRGNDRNLTYVEPPIRMRLMPWEIVKKYLLNETDIVSYCYAVNTQIESEAETFCNKEYYNRIPCKAFKEYKEACVTLNSLYGRPNETRTEVSSRSEIRFGIHPHDDLMDELRLHNHIFLSVHDPHTVLNPIVDGFEVAASNVYNIRLKKVVKHLLPPPYKTNCMDYMEQWRARGGVGPTNYNECTKECEKNISLKMFGCTARVVLSVGYETSCDSLLKYDESLFTKQTTECIENFCKPACYEEYYVPTITVEPKDWTDCPHSDEEKLEIPIFVNLKLDGMETTTYTFRPKYQDIETFSYVGGYVGMWLGISLVAVFDFLETVFLVVKYPLNRYKKFKNKRKTQDEMLYPEK